MAIAQFIKKRLANFINARWNIGIAEIGEDLHPKEIKFLKHNKNFLDSWFADPFIVAQTDEAYIVLVEEMIVPTGRGRISRLVVRKSDCQLLDCEPLLEVSTHLSFPNFIEYEGELYIYPENGASGELSYYRYGQKLEKCGVIIKKAIYDSVIFKFGELYYLFATAKGRAIGNTLDVYCSHSPLSAFEKIQEIVFEENIARRAGNVFKWKDKLISPAQVCNHYYGEGISMQEVRVENSKIECKEILRIAPPGREFSIGFHTWNFLPGSSTTAVIDGYSFGSKALHDFYFKARNLNEM